jgi:HEAT repeat protein
MTKHTAMITGTLMLVAAFRGFAAPPAAMDVIEERLGHPPTVPELVKLLEDKESVTNRAEAARALGELGPDAVDAVPALAARLADEDDGVRANTASALSSIGPGAKQAVPALLKALNDKYDIVRSNAVGALISIKPTGKEAVQALIAKMKDRDGYATRAAPMALGAMGTGAKDAIPALTEAIEKWEDYCREPACALGQMGQDAKVALPTLRKKLDDLKLRLRNKNVQGLDRGDAARSLIEVAAAIWKLDRRYDALKELMAVAEDRDLMYRGNLDHVRAAATKALGDIGPSAKDAVPLLTAGIKESEYATEWYAAEALGNMGGAAADAVPALLKLLEPGHHPTEVVIIALGKIGPPAKGAVSALEKFLASPNGRESLLAAEALWRIEKRADTVPVLVTSLKLKEIPFGVNSRYYSMIRPAIEIRRHAAQVLGELGPKAKAAIPALREALKDERLTVREAAAEALKKVDIGSK